MLNYTSSQKNNWIVIHNFSEIIGHKNVKIINEFDDNYLQLPTNLIPEHIYFTYMTDNKLITLVKTKKTIENESMILLIINTITVKIKETEEKEEENVIKLSVPEDVIEMPEVESVTSNIYVLKHIRNLCKYMQTSDRKKLDITKQWMQLSGPDKPKYNLKNNNVEINTFEEFFDIMTEDEYVLKFNEIYGENAVADGITKNIGLIFDDYGILKYDKSKRNKCIIRSNNVLNLTHNYSITDNVLNRIDLMSNIKWLILNQNHQLSFMNGENSFEFLLKFPNLELIDLSNLNRLTYNDIKMICKYVPKLRIINIHNCFCLNIRILLELFKLKYIEKICIDDKNFWCQRNTYELFVLPEEWENLMCNSLREISINSSNLTIDVIDYICNACPELKRMIVTNDVLTKIVDNITNGNDVMDVLEFMTWENMSICVRACRMFKFRNMFKDNLKVYESRNKFLERVKNRDENKNDKLDSILDGMTLEELKELENL